MKEPNFEVGDLLYHCKHGVVRCKSMTGHKGESGEKVISYTFVSIKENAGKARFIATMDALMSSGFRVIATEHEACKVCHYFSKGIVTAVPADRVTKTKVASVSENSLWQSAQVILQFAFGSFDEKDRNNHKLLALSAASLIEELSFSFDITRKETVKRVNESLGENINPLVLAALEKNYEN